MKALIHVAGDTALKGSMAPYSVGTRVMCSSSTFPPIASSISDDAGDVSTLILLPHSLVTYAEGVEGVGLLPEGDDLEELEGWLERASAHIGDLFSSRLKDSTFWLDEDSNPLNGVKMETRLVQVRGTFSFLGSLEGGTKRVVSRRRMTFHGDISHAFVEVFRFLDSGGFDSVHMDLSQGWNHLTVAAYLGAASYALTSGLDLELHASEPYIHGIGTRCSERMKSRKTEGEKEPKGRELPKVREEARLPEVELALQRPSELVLVQGLIQDISSITSSSRPIIPLRRLTGLDDLMRAEFSRYERELGDGWRVLLKTLARLRKVSCAYGSVILPYLHMAILRLIEVEGSLREVVQRLEGKLNNDDYVMRFRIAVGREGTIEVRYSLLPPLSFPLGRTMLRSIREIGLILPNLDGQKPGEMPLSMVDSLMESYERADLHPNRALLINEFDLLRDDSLVSVRDALRNASKGIIHLLKEYLNGLRKASVPPEEIRRREVYSFYCVPGCCRNLKECHSGSWEELRPVLEEVLRGKGGSMARNLRMALDIMRGDRKDPSSLLRNLMAHAGVQHFSVRNLLEESGEVLILYYVELFDAIERLASEDRGIESLERDIGEVVRTACDSFSGSTRAAPVR